MHSDKKTAISVGALYIAATVAGLLSVVFAGPISEKPLNLFNIAAAEQQVLIVAYLQIILAVTVAGIAFMVYPILKEDANTNLKKGLVVWYVSTRLTEGALFFVGVLNVLLLLKLSQGFVLAEAADASWYASAGTLIFTASEHSWMLGQTIFCIGAAMFYYLLFKSKRIPGWLSIWGLIATPLMFIANFLPLYGIDSTSVTYSSLCAPMGVQEMVLAVWLIVKGFNPSVVKD